MQPLAPLPSRKEMNALMIGAIYLSLSTTIAYIWGFNFDYFDGQHLMIANTKLLI
jgi:hypothetical protein